MKRSWLVDTTTVARSQAGVTGSPSRLSRSPCIPGGASFSNDGAAVKQPPLDARA